MTDEVETPEVEILGDTTIEPVVFTPAQQLKLDEILKKAMGRAGADARAEAADLKKKLAAAELRLKAQAPDATRSDVLAAELEASKATIASLQAANSDAAKATDIERLAIKHDFIDVELARKIVTDSVKRNADGTYSVLDASGSARVNSAGEPMTVDELMAETAAAKIFLIRGQVKSGGGGTSSGGVPTASTALPLSHYWGPNSSAKDCNSLSINRPLDYKRMRAEAVRQGLCV